MSAENLILNGDFSQGETHWRIYLPPGTGASAEIRDGYCQVQNDASVDQSVLLEVGKYRLAFEGLFPDTTGSYVNLALELSGYRQQIAVRGGDDYSPYALSFTVTDVDSNGKDIFTLGLVGKLTGGKYRNVTLSLAANN
ncbi:hypothetical protein HU765_23265 [Pseudomonas sp. SWRI81]|uniref:hypothetical protein n=1 Tax=Pseudomonas sp. SWRI81 TaxID=2745505 RepID=UPI0016443172|nr:hypothetical protein [Pseudomonas sp. SWRI81]MBC3272866.1 hypothetical protein [Pseudomonas sp. SWRI81]